VLSDEAYDGFVWGGVFEQGLASLPSYCQRCYGSGVGDGVSNGEDSDYFGQFDFELARQGVLVVQIEFGGFRVFCNHLKSAIVPCYLIFWVFYLFGNIWCTVE